MKIKKLLNLVICAVFASCTLAPNYEKPQVDLPLNYPSDASKAKIAIISWEKYFTSPDLQRVIRTALFNNRDLRVANLNIESVRATHGVVRANLLPTVNAVASETQQGVPAAFAGFMPKKQLKANINLAAYEIDFFGRLRSLKKAALEDYLASEQSRNVTKISLIAETANSYTQLLLDREMLKIAKQNLATQQDRLNFTKMRYENGIDSQSVFLNAKSLLETAKNNFETYKKLVKQDENALMLLMGVFEPSALPAKDIALKDIKINENLLDLVPSDSLLLRPDIKQAEYELKSANTNIGAARAAFFPSITLTGNYGYTSNAMSTLFDEKTWSFTPQVNMPLFAGGRNLFNLKIAQLRKKSEIAQYEKVIQTAFREVSDQLSERAAIVNQFESFNKILEASQKSKDISEARYMAGINSALDVLDSKIALFSAAQNQASAEKNYIANLISLYKVMGGGSELDI